MDKQVAQELYNKAISFCNKKERKKIETTPELLRRLALEYTEKHNIQVEESRSTRKKAG